MCRNPKCCMSPVRSVAAEIEVLASRSLGAAPVHSNCICVERVKSMAMTQFLFPGQSASGFGRYGDAAV
jgi:hypothetical protein